MLGVYALFVGEEERMCECALTWTSLRMKLTITDTVAAPHLLTNSIVGKILDFQTKNGDKPMGFLYQMVWELPKLSM